MNRDCSCETLECRECENLQEEYRLALETWKERRLTFERSSLTGKQVGTELQRLQASYAKAYIRLQDHRNSCEGCEAISETRRQSVHARRSLERKTYLAQPA